MDLIAEDSFWLTICALGSSIVIALLGIVPIILTPLYFSSSLKSFNAIPATISSISSTHNRSQRHPSSNKSHPQSTRPNRSVSGHRAKLNRSGDIPNGTISSASSPDAVSTTLTSADNFGFIDLQKMGGQDVESDSLRSGCWLLAGLFTFFAVERISNALSGSSPAPAEEQPTSLAASASESSTKSVTGYLSMFANLLDNTMHGMTVASSFLLGYKSGITTTLALVAHELPHEISDFTILLRSGFSFRETIVAQLFTGFGTLLGACVALWGLVGADSRLASALFSFMSGGFLQIALCSILSDLVSNATRNRATSPPSLEHSNKSQEHSSATESAIGAPDDGIGPLELLALVLCGAATVLIINFLFAQEQ